MGPHRTRREFVKGAGAAGIGLAAALEQGPARGSAVATGSKSRRNFEPAYVALHRTGELARRAEALWQCMGKCALCPRRCGVNRLGGERGYCRTTAELIVSSHHPHFGEEPELVGRGGSGTIFFSFCNFRCEFCINWQVSQAGEGLPASVERLAEMMLDLQAQGCVNINVVTPTHRSAHILRALDIAAGRGLRLPLVYNTNGWEDPEILRRLDGVVDIYLPDHKYGDAQMAEKYSAVPDYPAVTQRALLEMHRQVGTARPDGDGLIRRGVIVRHLVMPNRVAGSREVLEWIAANLPKDTYVNVMSQYTPAYRASTHPEIARRLTRTEYDEAVRWGRELGLTRVKTQPRFLL
ncbi:MAG: radical SAM protein [Verrucomicrobia bacterium]|nr:radical SAM protein [Verrucomicrobiota bacterium]